MRYLFGDFELDVSQRQLHRQGAPVHLSPKALQLLITLLERKPAALSKQELLDTIWPATFVSESNLATLINEIRTSLADRSKEPRFIRTVYSYGYAFCGVVTPAQESSEASMARGVAVLDFEGREFPLHEGKNILGREMSSDVSIDHATISRQHAVITLAGELATIEDLGSKNGTHVRGERVSSTAELFEGDPVRFGDLRCAFRRKQSNAPTLTSANGGERDPP